MGVTSRPAKGGVIIRRSNLLRTRLLEAIPESTIDAVVEKITDSALNGNVAATKLLLEYAAGRPAQAREVSTTQREPPAFDWEELRSLILGALGRYPQAKIDLADTLNTFARNQDDRDGSRPGPLDEGTGP